MKNILIWTVVFASISACSGEVKGTKKTEGSAPARNVVPVATKADWEGAFKRAVTEKVMEDKGDGKIEAVAEISGGVKAGGSWGVETRDSFRHLRHFKPGPASTMALMNYGPALTSYVALRDYEKPDLFLASIYSGRSWLFQDKVSVLADGDVVLEHNFRGNSDTDIESGGVSEAQHFIASPEEIEALRKIVMAKKVLIRISGSKGYVMVKPRQTGEFVTEVKTTLATYDALSKALEGKIPPHSDEKKS
ncbi:hypothetical protein [Chromobacterium violaceum]